MTGQNGRIEKPRKKFGSSIMKDLQIKQGGQKDASEPKLPQANENAELAATVPLVADESLFGSLVEIPLKQVDRNEAAIRTIISLKPFDRLCTSIAKNGVIDPILVRKQGERFKIIDGHRRVAASKKLHRNTIPAVLLSEKVSIQEERKIQLLGNLNREDWKPIELARALYNYLEALRPDLDLKQMAALFNTYEKMPIPSKKDSATVAAVREIIGKRSLSTIRNLLSLLKLPRGIVQAVDDERISYSNACILAANLDHPDFDHIADKTISKKPKRDDLKKMFKSPVQSEESPLSERHENLLRELNVLEKEIKCHLDQISHEEAHVLLRRLDDICRIIAQRIRRDQSPKE